MRVPALCIAGHCTPRTGLALCIDTSNIKEIFDTPETSERSKKWDGLLADPAGSVGGSRVRC